MENSCTMSLPTSSLINNGGLYLLFVHLLQSPAEKHICADRSLTT